MEHVVYADQVAQYPVLFESMFKSRAAQFSERLEWEVSVDKNGCEKDFYDSLNPIYLISSDEKGDCKGSMRFLPTTGDTMINDHFTELTGGVTIKSPFIWECTRFCLAPGAGRMMSAQILFNTLEIGLQFKLQFFIGIFSKPMLRIYDRIGWTPSVIGEGKIGKDIVCAGLWSVSESIKVRMQEKYTNRVRPLCRNDKGCLLAA